MNGAQSGSAVAVDNGGTLGGTGTTGTVTTNAGQTGTVSPGTAASPGTLNTSTVTLADSSSKLNIRLGGTSSYDQLNVAGTINLNNCTLSASISGYVPSAGDTFTIVTASTAVNGTFNNLSDGATLFINSYQFQINYNNVSGGHNVVLTWLGQTFAWTGNGTTSNWSDTGNWAGGLVPVAGSSVILTGAGTQRPTNQEYHRVEHQQLDL